MIFSRYGWVGGDKCKTALILEYSKLHSFPRAEVGLRLGGQPDLWKNSLRVLALPGKERIRAAMLCARALALCWLCLTYVRVCVYLKDVALLCYLGRIWPCFKNKVLNEEQHSLPMGCTQLALPAVPTAAGTGPGLLLVMGAGTVGVAWGGGQVLPFPAPAQQRPSAGDTPACPLVSILLSDAADSSQNCGSHYLSYLYHTLPLDMVLLCVCVPAPSPALLPVFRVALLDLTLRWQRSPQQLPPEPTASGQGPVGENTVTRLCAKHGTIKQGLHAGFSVCVHVPSFAESLRHECGPR